MGPQYRDGRRTEVRCGGRAGGERGGGGLLFPLPSLLPSIFHCQMKTTCLHTAPLQHPAGGLSLLHIQWSEERRTWVISLGFMSGDQVLDSRLLVTISSGFSLPFICTKLYIALCLVLPSAMIVENLITALEFTSRYDSRVWQPKSYHQTWIRHLTYWPSV